MRFCENYLIDGVPMLTPDAGVSIERNDIDSEESGRDDSAVMHRDVIRFRVKKWGFSYKHLTQEEYDYMKDLLDGKTEFEFSFVENGSMKSVIAYCSKDSISYIDASTGLYENFKISITEN